MKWFISFLLLQLSLTLKASCTQFFNYGEVPTFSLEKADEIITLLQKSFRDELLTKQWREIKKNNPKKYSSSHFGHCYAASEALYHLLGAKEAGLKPVRIKTEEGTHWYLRTQAGNYLDPTHEQFDYLINYEDGTPAGYLTKAPSKRAQVMIGEVLMRIKTVD